MRAKNIETSQALGAGRTSSIGRDLPSGRLQSVPEGQKIPVDGVEGVLVQGVRHTRQITLMHLWSRNCESAS